MFDMHSELGAAHGNAEIPGGLAHQIKDFSQKCSNNNSSFTGTVACWRVTAVQM